MLFLFLAVLFFSIIIYVSLDIASKTTFPGSKQNLKERIAPSNEKDTVSYINADSTVEN